LTKVRQVYKCLVCGNIVEVLHAGAGTLVCCGEEMQLLEEKTEDSSTEKHVPYVEKTEDGVVVKVGQLQEHPMEDKHYIEWIEVFGDEISVRKFLKPGDKPVATFKAAGEKIEARELCNVHGLWKS